MSKTVTIYPVDVLKTFKTLMNQYHDDVKALVIITLQDGTQQAYEFVDTIDGETFACFSSRYSPVVDVKLYNIWAFRNLFKHRPARSAKDHNV